MNIRSGQCDSGYDFSVIVRVTVAGFINFQLQLQLKLTNKMFFSYSYSYCIFLVTVKVIHLVSVRIGNVNHDKQK